MKRIFYTCLLLLFTVAVLSQKNYDSLLNQKGKDTTYIEALFDAGKKVENISMDSAFLFYSKALGLSIDIEYKKGIYTYYHHTAYAYGKQNEFEKAFKNLQYYLDMARENKNKLQEAKAYISYGTVYSWYGDAAKEVNYYQKAIELLTKLDDPKTLSVVYSNISSVYSNQKLYKEALHYANLSLEVDKKRNDEEGIAADYLGLANIYSDKKMPDSCIYFNKEALRLTRKINMPYMQVYALINWAREIKKIKPDSAIILTKESLALNEKMNYKTGIIKSNITLGECYLAKKEYSTALNILLKAKKDYDEEISKKEKLNLLDDIYSAYKNKGDYKMAIATDEEWQVLNDSLKTEETRDALFQFSKKEQQLISEKELSQKELKISRQQNWITALGLGALAVCGTGFFFFLYQRNKQQLKNKQIELLQKENEFIAVKSSLEGQLLERSRISKEIHDELGSSLTSISLLTEVLKKRIDTGINPEINKISDTSADMVDKMNEIIWALNTSNDTVNSLVAYVRKFTNNFLQDANMELEFLEINIPEHRPLEGSVRRNIYLTVKEAVNNIVKHSGAKKVTMEVDAAGGLQIKIKDDGKGIDTAMIRQFGNGLINMKKRMEDIGGTFSIENNNGTQIKLSY
jgi:signal transduction histidine kinase/tetratricopeptide (TPR) repeat protein